MGLYDTNAHNEMLPWKTSPQQLTYTTTIPCPECTNLNPQWAQTSSKQLMDAALGSNLIPKLKWCQCHLGKIHQDLRESRWLKPIAARIQIQWDDKNQHVLWEGFFQSQIFQLAHHDKQHFQKSVSEFLGNLSASNICSIEMVNFTTLDHTRFQKDQFPLAKYYQKPDQMN